MLYRHLHSAARSVYDVRRESNTRELSSEVAKVCEGGIYSIAVAVSRTADIAFETKDKVSESLDLVSYAFSQDWLLYQIR